MQHCAWCATFLVRPLSCQPCRSVSYCGRECQRSDWPEHRRSCVWRGRMRHWRRWWRNLRLAACETQLRLLTYIPDKKHCAWCAQFLERPLSCQACRSVSYCGIECQHNHWPEHRKSCLWWRRMRHWRRAWRNMWLAAYETKVRLIRRSRRFFRRRFRRCLRRMKKQCFVVVINAFGLVNAMLAIWRAALGPVASVSA